jgi:hypothetical protein
MRLREQQEEKRDRQEDKILLTHTHNLALGLADEKKKNTFNELEFFSSSSFSSSLPRCWKHTTEQTYPLLFPFY